MSGARLAVTFRVPDHLDAPWANELIGSARRDPRLDCTVERLPAEAEGGVRRGFYELLDRAVFARRRFETVGFAPVREREPAPTEGLEAIVVTLCVRARDAPGGEGWFIGIGGDSNPAGALVGEHRRGDLTFRVAIETAPPTPGQEPEEVEAAVCGMDAISLHRSRIAAADRVGELLETAIARRLRCVEPPPMPEPASADGRGIASALPPRLIATGGGRALRRDQWSILWRAAAPTSSPWELGNGPWHRIVPPEDRAYADPFPHERDGVVHVFMEEFPFRTRKGVISVSRLFADGSASPPVRVLETDAHLSYPFVFDHEGETYMLPESSASGRVTLYRCTDYPTSWEPVAALLEGVAVVDTTVCELAGRWWMWAGIPNHRDTAADRLALFSAPELTGPWEAHPQSPVVSDVRCARPAGAILRRREDLIRPVQDGSGRYGRRLGFRRIEVLTPERYAESSIAEVEPGELGAEGVHTYNRSAGLETLDVVRPLLRAPWRE